MHPQPLWGFREIFYQEFQALQLIFNSLLPLPLNSHGWEPEKQVLLIRGTNSGEAVPKGPLKEKYGCQEFLHLLGMDSRGQEALGTGLTVGPGTWTLRQGQGVGRREKM